MTGRAMKPWQRMAGLFSLGLCLVVGPALAQNPAPDQPAAPAPGAPPAPVRAKRLVGLNVTEASVRPSSAGRPEVLIKLSPQSKDALALFSAAHVGSEIEILVEGQAVSRARLVEPLKLGELMLAGDFDRTAAETLASRLSNQARLELRIAAN